MEPRAFRLAAQRLNHLHYRVPLSYLILSTYATFRALHCVATGIAVVLQKFHGPFCHWSGTRDHEVAYERSRSFRIVVIRVALSTGRPRGQ
jgi:hypothetical protein